MSGIDLAIGRWDVHGKYPLFDKGPKKTFPGNHFWNMFNDQSGQNQETSDGHTKDFLNRENEMRSPWHDIGSSLIGQAAADVGRHFIERWNNHMMARFKAAVKVDSLLGLRQWRIPAFGESLAKQIISPKLISNVSTDQNIDKTKSTVCNVQILRSSSSWSAGIENTENSIMKTYCNLIKSSKNFIFIENQFFVTSAGKSTTGGALVSR